MKLDEAIYYIESVMSSGPDSRIPYGVSVNTDCLRLCLAYIQASRELVEAVEGYPGIHALDKALANIKKLEG